VVFCFCLSPCDRDDLFRIASQDKPVLRSPRRLKITGSFRQKPRVDSYHHLPYLKSYKMDYRGLFTWYPNYECMTHKVRHHVEQKYTYSQVEWVAVSVLKKQSHEA